MRLGTPYGTPPNVLASYAAISFLVPALLFRLSPSQRDMGANTPRAWCKGCLSLPPMRENVRTTSDGVPVEVTELLHPQSDTWGLSSGVLFDGLNVLGPIWLLCSLLSHPGPARPPGRILPTGQSAHTLPKRRRRELGVSLACQCAGVKQFVTCTSDGRQIVDCSAKVIDDAAGPNTH